MARTAILPALILLLMAALGAPDLYAAPQDSTRELLLQASWIRHKAMADSSIFRGLPWRSVGPVVQGGRLVDIEVVPGEPYSFYIAYASGGVWKTTNNGQTFEPLFDDQPCIIIGDMAIDPSNPETLWVGTGENNSSRSSYGGMGVFRSDDGGKTWSNAGLMDSDRIGRILVHPEKPDQVFAAVLGRLYTTGGPRGIYRTTDGGKSWERVLHVDNRTGFVDLAMDPADPNVLYAAAWDRIRRPWKLEEGGPGSGIWKSTDGGDTWRQLEGDFPRGDHIGRIGLALAPSQPATLYAMVDNQEVVPEEEQEIDLDSVTVKRLRSMTREEFLDLKSRDLDRFLRQNNFESEVKGEDVLKQVENEELTIEEILRACTDANAELFDTDIRGIELWRTDDGGENWRKTHDDSLQRLANTYGYYFGQVRVTPDDPESVYLLGVPLLKSEDGGKTFKGCNQANVHSDMQAMWIDPDFPNRIILGNDGGLNMTYDGGENWLKLNTTSVGQFYTVTVDGAKPYNIYGGLQDNGILKGPSTWRSGSSSWEFVGGGDGMYVQVDARDNQTVYYGSQFGHYARRDASGRRESIRPKNKLKRDALRYNWCTPVQLSSFNPDIVYFGAQSLHRSMDQGKTWEAVSPDLTRSGERGNVPYATITTLAESPITFGLIWAGTDDGYVHVTDDGGREWREVSAALPDGLWCTRVEPSRHEEQAAYVSFSGYREDDSAVYLFRTEDLGANWESISEGLPQEPVNVIREDPHDPDILYAGTDRGAYVSLNRGGSWNALSGGLPRVPVHDLAVHPGENDLVAGTHGRSVWVLDVKPIQDLDEEIQAKAVYIYALEAVTERFSWGRKPSSWFDRPDRRPKERIVYWSSDSGDGEFTLHDEDGRLLVRNTFEAFRGLNIYEWDYLVDLELALAAEVAREEEKAGKEDAGKEDGDKDGKDKKAQLEAEKDGEQKDPPRGRGGRGRGRLRDRGQAGETEDGDGPEKRTYKKVKEDELLPYIVPGKYKLRISVKDGSHEIDLEVKAGGGGRR